MFVGHTLPLLLMRLFGLNNCWRSFSMLLFFLRLLVSFHGFSFVLSLPSSRCNFLLNHQDQCFCKVFLPTIGPTMRYLRCIAQVYSGSSSTLIDLDETWFVSLRSKLERWTWRQSWTQVFMIDLNFTSWTCSSSSANGTRQISGWDGTLLGNETSHYNKDAHHFCQSLIETTFKLFFLKRLG